MFEFSTGPAALYASLFLVISVLISFYFYRKVVVKNWKKYTLIVIKSLAIFLLLMLFLQPVLLSLHGSGGSPLNIVLIDNSRSLTINNNDSATMKLFNDLKTSGGELKLFTFSGSVEQTDSFSSDGAYTNLANSLEQLKILNENNPFNSVTVVSDGNFNTGGNPVYNAKSLGCPFITVPVGDSLQQKDILLYNAAYNKTAFINIVTKVKIFIKAFKTGNENITLKLEREGSFLAEKQVIVNQDEVNYTSDFDFSETTPGKYKYRITAESINGEITTKNNHFEFYIEFLDNKIRLLFVSGGPSYDNAVVSSIVKRFSNYETTIKTLKTPSEFYEGNIDQGIYKDLSAIMLLNFPTVKYSGNSLNEIYTNSKKFNIPVIFFAGKNTDYKKLDILSDFTPFSVTQSSAERNVKLQNISMSDENISFDIGSTPDLFRNTASVQLKPGAISIMTDKYSGEPVLLTRKSGNTTSTAFLAYGFWQWKLKNNNEKQIEDIINRSIQISLSKSRNKKFIVTPEKEFFDYTEDVIIYAEAYDDNNIPLAGAEIKGKIKEKSGSVIKDIDFKFLNGKYYSNCGKISIGDYIIEAEASLEGSNFANDINRFSVDTLNNEFLQTTIDYNSLNSLAGNTKGKTAKPDGVREVVSSIHNENISERSGIFERINLRENARYLILIILLFSIEWVVKKRNNIP